VTTPREETETPEVAPTTSKPRLSIVVILSLLLGSVFTLLVGGALLYFQQRSALQGEMKAQIEALSKQMYSLKEYALARAGAEGEKKTENVLTEVPAPAPKPALAPEPAPVVVKKPTPEAPNCGLVGKSPEEQAATLKRCVMLMDSPGEKPRKP